MKANARVNKAILVFLRDNGPASSRDICTAVSKRYHNLTPSTIGHTMRTLCANGSANIVGDTRENGHIYAVAEAMENEQNEQE